MIWEKLVDHDWREVNPHDLLELTNLEGQPWLVLYNLVCDTDCRRRYHLNRHRKDSILRVRKYLNEVILDQLPVLAHVQRYLDELVVVEAPHVPTVGSTLIMEQVPVIYDSLRLRTSSEWDALAMALTTEPDSGAGDECGAWFATPDLPDDPTLLALADLYGRDDIEELLGARGGKGSEVNAGTAQIVNVALTSGKGQYAADFRVSNLEPTRQQTSHGLFDRFQLRRVDETATQKDGNANEQSSQRLLNHEHLQAQILFANGSVTELCTEEPLELPNSGKPTSFGSVPSSKWVKLGSLLQNMVVQIHLKHVAGAPHLPTLRGKDCTAGSKWVIQTVFLSLHADDYA